MGTGGAIMLVCKNCHGKRQERQFQESQPLQFTGYETTRNHPLPCPSCELPSKGPRYEYMNAYELAGELQDAKDRIKALERASVWEVPIYADAAEMLHAVTLGPDAARLQDPEIMLRVLRYAADCEAR